MYKMYKITTLILFSVLCFTNVSLESTKNNVTCNESCMVGTYRLFKQGIANCSWICEICQAKTISNTTDSLKCLNCSKGYVSNPQRTECAKYKMETYSMSRPMGIIIIILIFFVIALILFTFILFTRNREHELVRQTGYSSLCIFLLGCLLIVIAPIPLPIQPEVASCSAYIAMFNIGLTICFGVLITRSSYVNNFFNDDYEVVKSCLGKFPRMVILAVVLVIQIIIVITGLVIKPPETLAIETNQWNVGYWECSSWASHMFWIGFAYNVFLSLFGNFLSCTSTKMEETCEELKYVLMSYLVFYLFALVEVILFFRVINEMLTEAQAFLCILYTLSFYICYIVPKVFVILYCTKEDGRTVKQKLHSNDDDAAVTSLIHSKDGYAHRVIQMKIKSVEE